LPRPRPAASLRALKHMAKFTQPHTRLGGYNLTSSQLNF
jgi:hypothetical protein